MTHLTRVPEVLDRILELLRNKTDPAIHQVLDGPTVSGNYKDIVFLIGYRPDAKEDIPVTRTNKGLGVNEQEIFSIGFLINAVDGMGVVRSARQKAASALAILEGILITNDPTLTIGDGIVIRLGDHSWRAIPTTKGIEQTVSGVIDCEVLL